MKIRSKVLVMSILGTMLTANVAPVFAASNEVPVYGRVGIWKDGSTNPDGSGGGEGTPDNPIIKPTVTDISVTVPAAMVFNIVSNTEDGNPVMATTDYNIVNNSKTGLNVEAQYTVTDNKGIVLEDRGNVSAVKDGTIKLAVGLVEKGGSSIISSLKNNASGAFELAQSGVDGAQKTLTFVADASDMSDVKVEQPTNNKLIKSKLVLTFTKKQ